MIPLAVLAVSPNTPNFKTFYSDDTTSSIVMTPRICHNSNVKRPRVIPTGGACFEMLWTVLEVSLCCRKWATGRWASLVIIYPVFTRAPCFPIGCLMSCHPFPTMMHSISKIQAASLVPSSDRIQELLPLFPAPLTISCCLNVIIFTALSDPRQQTRTKRTAVLWSMPTVEENPLLYTQGEWENLGTCPPGSLGRAVCA